jgi:hypothetical protein
VKPLFRGFAFERSLHTSDVQLKHHPAPSAPPTTPYGTPIGLEAAKKVMTAAEAEAAKNHWGMAIVLDSTGHMVMLHKMDNTQYGSIAVAEGTLNLLLNMLARDIGWRVAERQDDAI